MQLIPLPAHPTLHVPTDIRSGLDAAVAEGHALATAWLHQHPSAPAEQVAAFAQGTVTLPPGPAVIEREAARIARAQAHVSPATMEAAHWLSLDGQPSGRLKRTSWWTQAITRYRHAAIAAHGKDQGVRDALRAGELLQQALKVNDKATFDAKYAMGEPRPYTHRPGATPPAGGWSGQDVMSHPSGHASRAWVAAGVLARLWPAHAAEFLDVARGVSHSRLLEDMHFPHDVVLGARLGTLVADVTLANAPAGTVPVLD